MVYHQEIQQGVNRIRGVTTTRAEFLFESNAGQTVH